jgi:hypothetical protein
MFNLIITAIGVFLLIIGFYLMSFGFSTPPNSLFFFLGLCIAVVGLILVVFFVSGVEISGRNSPNTGNVSKTESNIKPKPKQMKIEKKVPIQKKKEAKLDNIKKTIKSEEPAKPKPRIINPKKVEHPKESIKPKPKIINPKKAEHPPVGQKSSKTEVKPESKIEKPKNNSFAKINNADESLDTQKKPTIKKIPKKPDMTKLTSMQHEKDDDYVKKRLDRLKESYIENTEDIESIIDERLDSFKGTLGKLKSESKEPGIIWSFDADDVKQAMVETISKTNNRLLMMYPWIRNIEISTLKKFMETDSCIIIQEASLDDDASVELLKLLIDKKVKIRTMPHVHTIAIVSDNKNGLIISTDPIYDSYEVGVVYRDQKSIEEIERLFKDAWSISQDIDLEIKS